jgi:predicted PurR-regulated permease PerM
MMEKKNAATLLLAGITTAALYSCYLLFRPYITPILFASVIAIVFYPLHRYTQRTVRGTTASALISTLVTLLLTFVPLTFLLFAISNELRGLYQDLAARSAGAGGMVAYLLQGLERLTAWASRHFPIPAVDLHGVLLSRLETASSSLLQFGANLVSNLFAFVVSAAIALLVLFFLFRDGERAVSKVMAALPFDEARLSQLRARISSAVMTNFYGGVVVGALQGTLTGLSFWALGIDSPVLWGVVTGVFSLVPIFGSAIVWVPASIVLLLTGHYVKAAILLGLGAFLISTIDNVVRPLIIHKGLRLHPVFIFLSILGGVQLFGALGLFVGPVILSVTAALLAMMQEDLAAQNGSQDSKELPAIHVAGVRPK